MRTYAWRELNRQPVASGARDKLVRVDAISDGQAPSGYPTGSPTTLASVYMSKQDFQGDERFVANQLSAPYNTRFEMPYAAWMDPEVVDVTKTRRLVYRNRVYDIVNASRIGDTSIELLTLSGGLVS